MALQTLIGESCSATSQILYGLPMRGSPGVDNTVGPGIAFIENGKLSGKGRKTEADMATRIEIRRVWESLLSAPAWFGTLATYP